MRVINLANFPTFTAINLLVDPGAIGGPVIIPNCVQIKLNWNLTNGKIGHNVLYGRAAGVPAPTVAQAQAIFSALSTGAAWTAWASILATTTSFASVSLRSVHAAGAPEFLSTGAAVPGTDAGIALPNEMAICVTLRTALAGTGHRGRFYVPGESVVANTASNVISAGAVGALNGWVTGFTSIFAGQGYTWVLGLPARQAYVGASGTQHPARAAGSEPITQATVRNNTWDSQRRRGLK